MNPVRLAQQELDRTLAEGIQQRAQRQLEEDAAELPTFWKGFDPTTGQHIIQRVGGNPIQVGTSLSSGGFQVGQAVDTAYSQGYTAIDTRPYVAPTPQAAEAVRSTLQIAILIFVERETIPDGAEDPVKLPGKLFLKLNDQRLSVIDAAVPLTGPDYRLPIDMLAIGKGQWVIACLNPDETPTIYYANRGQISSFSGTLAPIPDALSGEQYFIYPANSIANYLPKSQWRDYPNYYWAPAYLQQAPGYLPATYGQLSIAPYKRKWVVPLNVRYGFIVNNWLDLLRNSKYKIQPDYPRGQTSAASIALRLSQSDITTMGFSGSTEIRAGSDSRILGTFASPGTGWQESQLEIREAGVFNLLSISYYRGIPIDA